MKTTSDARTASAVLGRERQAPRAQIALDDVLQAGLVDRDLALLERRDLGFVLVGADDLHAELREAGAGHETDVPGSDHADVHRLISPSNARSW